MSERAKWTKGKLERYLKEGRGLGEGKNYKPWIKVNDYSSYGRSTRILGSKTNRVHHLNSDTTLNFFYLFEWDDRVVDIRETYPLIDVDEILQNYNDLRFDLFKDRISEMQYILTTSFLLTVKEEGKNKLIARSIKMSSDLNKSNVIEKMEIERRYWKSKGVDWGLITEKELPLDKCKNIKWVHSSLLGFQDRGYSKDEVIEETWKLIKFISNNKYAQLRKVISKFDDEYMYSEGTGLYLLKYAIASKFISIDMDERIDLNKSGENLIKSINCKEGSTSVSG